MSYNAAYFNDGNPVSNKNICLHFKGIREMGNRIRIVFTDSNGSDISNIICNRLDWEKNVIKEKGDTVKILVANKINLKNGRAAYQLKDWEVVRSNSGSASATGRSAINWTGWI